MNLYMKCYNSMRIILILPTSIHTNLDWKQDTLLRDLICCRNVLNNFNVYDLNKEI